MKYIKIALSVLLILVVLAGLSLIFSDRMIEKLLKDGDTRFKNVNYVLEKGEIEFSNFYLKGRDLGKGRAKLVLEGSEISIVDMELEEFKENAIFQENADISAFIKGLTELVSADHVMDAELSTTDYIGEKMEEVEEISKLVDAVTVDNAMPELEKLNQAKKEYAETRDLKVKIEKIKEIRDLSKVVAEKIDETRKTITATQTKVIAENEIVMKNLATDLENLQNKVSLNEPENLDRYIFIDNGEKLLDSQEKGLKIIQLVKELKSLNFTIANLNIGNGKITLKNLKRSDIDVDTKFDFSGKIKGKNDKYTLTYSFDKVEVNTEHKPESISSKISYKKDDLIDGKVVELIAKTSLTKNSFAVATLTTLTEEEKAALRDQTKKAEENAYLNSVETYAWGLGMIENIEKKFVRAMMRLDDFRADIVNVSRIVKNGGEDEAR